MWPRRPAHPWTLLRLAVPSRSGTANMAMETQYQVTLWFVLVILALFLALSGYQPFQPVARDETEYILLARSLVHSAQYGLNFTPGETAVTRYPFGYPLMLAAPLALFSDNFDAMRALSLLATLLNGAVLFWGWRWFSRQSAWWGLAITGLYLLSPGIIGQTRVMMSDPLFTTWCLLTILLTERAVRGQPSYRWSFCVSLTSMFAVFTRTIGVVLVLTMFAYLLYKHGRGYAKYLALMLVQMAFLTGVVIALTPVQVSNVVPIQYVSEFFSWYVFRTSGPADHPLELAAVNIPTSNATTGNDGSTKTPAIEGLLWIAHKVHLNIPEDYFLVEFAKAGELHVERHIRAAVLPASGGKREQAFGARLGIPALPILIGLFVSVLIVLGYMRWYAEEGITAFSLFGAVYLLSLFAWLWDVPRFLFPILPQLHFCLLLGLAAVRDKVIPAPSRSRVAHRIKTFALPVVVSLLLLVSAVQASRADDTRAHVGDLAARTRWLRANTSESAIIMSEQAELDFLYSGRKTVNYANIYDSSAQLRTFLVDHNVDYILVAPNARWQENYRPAYRTTTEQLLPWIDELVAQNELDLLYAPDHDLVRVYQVRVNR